MVRTKALNGDGVGNGGLSLLGEEGMEKVMAEEQSLCVSTS